jgi:hypothetical protein
MFVYGLGPTSWYDNGGGYEFHMGGKEIYVDAPKCEEKDGQALKALMQSVQQRAHARLRK